MFRTTWKVENDLIQKYLRHLYKEDQLLSKIAVSVDIHHGGARYGEGDKKLIAPKKLISSDIKIKREDIIDYNIDKFSERLFFLAENQKSQLKKMSFDQVENITDLTGNKIDARGASLSPEMVLEMLEKIPMGFDDNGNPQMPTIVANDNTLKKLQKQFSSKDFDKRLRELIDKKRVEYYAHKRNRKLSRIN